MSDSEFSIGGFRVTCAEIRDVQERLAHLVKLRNAQVIYLYDEGRGRTGRELAVASELTEGRMYQIIRAGRGAEEGTYNGLPVMGHLHEGEFLSGVTLDGDHLESV